MCNIRSFTEARYEAAIRLAAYRALSKYSTAHLGYDEDPVTVVRLIAASLGRETDVRGNIV